MTTTETPSTEAQDMDLRDLMDQIQTVSPEHLAEGKQAIREKWSELLEKHKEGSLTDEDRELRERIKSDYEALEVEEGRRADVQAADDEAFGAIDLDGATESESDGESEETEVADDAESETDDEVKTKSTANAQGKGQSPEQLADSAAAEAAPMAASGSRTTATPRLPLNRIAPTEAPKPTGDPTPKASIVAGAGSSRERETDLDRQTLLRDMHHAIRANDWGGHGKVVVASVRNEVPDERRLSERLTGHQNADLIERQQGTSTAPITAAGGLVAPFQIDYSVDTQGSSERPLQSMFPHYVADRGGVQIRRDVDPFGGTAINASGTWTLANDADADNATPKPIWDVPTFDVIQAQVRAVTQGVRMSNITAKFDPEGTAAALRTVDITHARYGERLLLADMFSQCTVQMSNAGTNLGLTRDLVVAFDKAAAYLRESLRLGANQKLKAPLPVWLREAIRSDMARAMHTSNPDWLALADSAIDAIFTNRNIDVTWVLDGRDAQASSGTSGTAIPATQNQYYSRTTTNSSTMVAYPGTVEFALFPEGTFVYLDGGELDVGIIRDQQLVQKNRYVMFQETFEGLYRKGVQAIRVVQGINIKGGSAGAIDPSGIAN